MGNEILTIDAYEQGAVSVSRESVLNDSIYREIFKATLELQRIVELRNNEGNNEGTKPKQLEEAEHLLWTVKRLLAKLEEEIQTRRL